MELVAAISGSGEMRTYKIATAMITTMTALARDNTIFNHTPGRLVCHVAEARVQHDGLLGIAIGV
jgi:hypothetical protein